MREGTQRFAAQFLVPHLVSAAGVRVEGNGDNQILARRHGGLARLRRPTVSTPGAADSCDNAQARANLHGEHAQLLDLAEVRHDFVCGLVLGPLVGLRGLR